MLHDDLLKKNLLGKKREQQEKFSQYFKLNQNVQ